MSSILTLPCCCWDLINLVGGVSTWLINNVHVIVKGPWRRTGPFLSVILLVSIVSLLKFGFSLFMLIVWLLSCLYI